MDRQTSADAHIGTVPDFKGEYAGALTWAYIRSIKEATLKGTVNLSKISWRDLVHNIRFKLNTGGYQQVPQLCVANKDKINTPVDL